MSHLLWVLVLAATPAESQSTSAAALEKAPPATVQLPAARKPHELRAAVSAAMRRAATTTGEQQQAAIAELVALHGELGRDTQMVKDDRIKLGLTIRSRLQRVAADMKKAGKLPNSDQAVLAQQLPGLGQPGQFGQQPNAGGPQRPADHGQELLELIQATIAPGSWDINGGLGTIVYFGAMHVLVVRQTGEVHADLGDLLKQLHP